MNPVAGGVNQMRLANIIGIVVLLLAMFGIDVSDEQRQVISAGLGALGLIINQVITEINSRKGTMLSDNQAVKADVTTITPQVVQVSGGGTDAAVTKLQGGFARVSALWLIAGCVFLLAATACTFTKPESVQDTIATGYTLVKTAAQLTGSAKLNGAISAAQRDQYLYAIQNAKDSLDAASQLVPVDLSSAEGKANAATTILNTIITELKKLQPTVQGALT